MSCRTCKTRPVAPGYEASGECAACYWVLTHQSKAAAKRARKAAKREEDARRTEEGRAPWLHARRMLGVYPTWDWVSAIHTSEMHGSIDAEEAAEWLAKAEPRWRQRLDHRRSLPWVGRPWAWEGSPQWRAWERQRARRDRFDAERCS